VLQVSTGVLNNVVRTVDNLQSEMTKRADLANSVEIVTLAFAVENFASRVNLNQSNPVHKVLTNNIHVEVSCVWYKSYTRRLISMFFILFCRYKMTSKHLYFIVLKPGLRSRSRNKLEVFGWSRSRIPSNAGSCSQIFCPTPTPDI